MAAIYRIEGGVNTKPLRSDAEIILEILEAAPSRATGRYKYMSNVVRDANYAQDRGKVWVLALIKTGHLEGVEREEAGQTTLQVRRTSLGEEALREGRNLFNTHIMPVKLAAADIFSAKR